MPSAAVKNIDATSPMFDEIMYLWVWWFNVRNCNMEIKTSRQLAVSIAHLWWKNIPDEGLHIVVNGAAFSNSRYNCAKVVICQDHVWCFLSNLCSRTLVKISSSLENDFIGSTLMNVSMRLQRELHNNTLNECNATMSVVITLWESLTTCKTTFIMNSSDKLPDSPMTSSAPDRGEDKYIIICLKIQANHYTNISILSFCCTSGSAMAWHWLPWDKLMKKIDSILIKAATSLWGYTQFISPIQASI
jgi:hypothetical protein